MRIIHLLSIGKNNSRYIFAPLIAWALTFTACERKSMIGDHGLTSDTILQPTVADALPMAAAASGSGVAMDMTVPVDTTHQADPVPKTTTFETARLGASIDRFERTPTLENQSSVKLAFSELAVEIAKLESRVFKTGGNDRAEAAAKSQNLQAYRDAEMVRFTKDQAATILNVETPVDTRSGAQKARDTALQVREDIKDGVRKVGKTIEKGARNTDDAARNAAN